MPALNFQTQFAPAVERGEKCPEPSMQSRRRGTMSGSWRTKVGRRLAWGYETASDGQWQRDGRIRRFMPTWTYRHGLLVAGLILFARWYWLGVVVRLHGGKGYGSSGEKGNG